VESGSTKEQGSGEKKFEEDEQCGKAEKVDVTVVSSAGFG